MRLIPACLAYVALALPVAAQPALDTPIDCTLGETCFIQNYVDRDPGPGARDFTCAGLSYDGHKGTDFALPSHAEMQAGVDIRAAAAGTIRGMRDGMEDRVYSPADAARIDGKDCGNGVVIDHGDGWETQYCHMKRGSVQVRSGQQVAAGDILGQVGLSGRTQFPHLHISVRHNGATVDPFTPQADADTCGMAADQAMWTEDLAYQPGAILSVGFSSAVPEYAEIKAGRAAADHLDMDAPAIVLWGFAFGGRAGDEMELTIDGDRGRVFETRQSLDKDQAQFFRAGGKRLRAPLSPGAYTGTVTLWRDGTEVSRKSVTLTAR